MPHAPCLRELLGPPLKLISKLSSPLKLVSKLKKKKGRQGNQETEGVKQRNYKDDSEEKPMILVHAAGLKSNESRLELKS